MAIKILIMDVDGTLTDGLIYMGVGGELCKAFNIKDGYGIHDILIPHGVIPVIITGRKSKIVENRCKEIGIKEVYQGVNDKVSKMNEILEKFDIQYVNTAYIGDDLNDLKCMKLVKAGGGVIGCPKDAANEVVGLSNFVSTHNGGQGAVREFIEWIVLTNL